MPESVMPRDEQTVGDLENRLRKRGRGRLYDAIAGLLLSLAIVGHLLFGSCPGRGILARIAPNDKTETAVIMIFSILSFSSFSLAAFCKKE